MKSEVAIPLPAGDQTLTQRMQAYTIARKQPAHRWINGIYGIVSEVVFALGLCLVGFLISMIFGG